MSNLISDTNTEDAKKLPGVDDIAAKYAQLSDALNKIQISVTALRSDVDKLKVQQTEKVSRAVFSELEGRVNIHSKGIESTSKKLCELNGNLTTFTSQPISFQVIEGIQTHLEEIIIKEVRCIIEAHSEELKKLIDDRDVEIRKMLNNTKRFMFNK